MRGLWERLQAETEEATEEVDDEDSEDDGDGGKGSDDVSNEVTAGESRPSVEVEFTCEKTGLVPFSLLGIHGQLEPLRKNTRGKKNKTANQKIRTRPKKGFATEREKVLQEEELFFIIWH